MATSRNDAEIPVIDLSSSSPVDQIAKALLDAASTHGFLYVKNGGSGILPEEIAQVFDVSREFFDAPTEVKAECSIHTAGKNRGWLSMHTENLDPANHKTGDSKEAFNLGEFKHGKAQQPLPKPLIPHEAQLDSFITKCHALCVKLLELFAIALEIPSSAGGHHFFSTRHDLTANKPSGSIFRLLYYPPPTPSITPASGTSTLNITDSTRAGAHSDYGSLTLLFRLPHQSGLEILTRQNKWASVPVNPIPDDEDEPPILVNIGDLLSYWTNGLLKSTVHRVVFTPASSSASEKEEGEKGEGEKEEARYSIAYFCHPHDEAELLPVPSEVVQSFNKGESGGGNGEGVGYGGGAGGMMRRPGEGGEVLTAKKHLNKRLAATYGIEEDD